jgi:tetratricopeptide (TPR) repeat protein
MRHVKRLALLFSFVSAFPLTAFATDELLISAKEQLDNGNPQAAYNLLIPLQPERAGDPEYDLVLGSAALAIGKNTEAVFALERVLAVEPNSAPARALIARAYFNLKETEAAKREFENVRKQKVAPEVATAINRFLEAIERIEAAERTSIHGFVEVGIGHDSNVNSATADNRVAVPFFGGTIFSLAASSVEQEDAFASFGGGVNFQHPLSKRLGLFGGLAYHNKSNFNETNFSTYYYDTNLGLSYRRDRDTLTLAAQYNTFFVNNSAVYKHAYRNASGVTGQWQHDFDSRNQASFFIQYSQLEYPDKEIRNADRYVGGAGYAHAFGRGTLITYLGVYGGVEDEKEDGVPRLGHHLYGARLGAQWNMSEKFALFLNASGERREYGGPDPFFLVDRVDTEYNASTGLIFSPWKGVRVTTQAGGTRNDSNIPINAYDRVVYQITLRYDI